MVAMTYWGESKFTAAAGTRMHAAVLGSRPERPMSCVHGLGVSHRYFKPFTELLASSVRVTASACGGGRLITIDTALTKRHVISVACRSSHGEVLT